MNLPTASTGERQPRCQQKRAPHRVDGNVACEKRAHICRCVAVDVAVVKRHGATIDVDASPLHRNDEIVKASTPSGLIVIIGSMGWFHEVESDKLTLYCEHGRAANGCQQKQASHRVDGMELSAAYIFSTVLVDVTVLKVDLVT